MRRIRFETIAEVFETFPSLRGEVKVAPSEEAPLAFLERLVRAGEIADAVTLAAHILPRREVVWWACRCVAANAGRMTPEIRHTWEIAAAWVHRPDEKRRLAAWEAAKTADDEEPTTWLLRAVTWSGGAMEPDSAHPVSPPPELCGKAARGAVKAAAAREGDATRATFYERCVSTALAIGRDEGDLAEEVLRTVRA